METVCRILEITVISASNLENVRERFKMKAYAVVSIGGNPETEKRTPVDKEGETNPAWNFTIKCAISTATLQKEGVMLGIKLYCKRRLGDRYIGEVQTSIKDLCDLADLAHANGSGGTVTDSYPARKGSEISQGELKFSCRFGKEVTILNDGGGEVHNRSKISSWGKKIALAGAAFFAEQAASEIYDSTFDGRSDET